MAGTRPSADPAMTREESRSRQCKRQLAELLDRGRDLVAGPEPDLLVLEIAGGNVEDAALGAQSETGPVRPAQGRKGHSPGQVPGLRRARRLRGRRHR